MSKYVITTRKEVDKFLAKYLFAVLEQDSFPGLVPLIHSYLGSMDVDADTHCTIQQYLKLIQKRASGELLTTASWIRQQIINHPEYK